MTFAGSFHEPDNWRWRNPAHAAEPGPAVVFDMDGVLSDAASRQHYIEGPGRRDWHAFFEACGDDPLIEEVAALLDLLDASLRIVLLTQDLRHTLSRLQLANEELTAARHEVSRLEQELLPICSFCKKVRDPRGDWHELEDFLSERQMDVTHGVCPSCRELHYPALPEKRRA